MRQKQTTSGKTYFYYDTCNKPRKWLPLGNNLYEALKKYADFEKEYHPDIDIRMNNIVTFRYVAERYVNEVVPTKSPRTQKDNLRELKKLLDFFDNPPAPINQIKPIHIRQYLDWRGQTAKIRANREKALFSHIFNKAREWGYTEKENPCRGIRGFKESGRDVYITDDLFWKLYENGDKALQNIMLVAYFTGQRVADLLKMKVSDIQNDELFIQQNKTGMKVRIKLIGFLKKLINSIIYERGNVSHNFLFTKNGNPLNQNALRISMDKARDLAGIEKHKFQFRDLRAKAATDKDEEMGIEAAQILLGHKKSSMTHHYIRNRREKLAEPTKVKIEKKQRKKTEM